MFYIEAGQKRAVIEQDGQGNDIAVLKSRKFLRLTQVVVDYAAGSIRCLYHWGVWDRHDRVFSILERSDPVIVELRDADFTELVTPPQGSSRWHGDWTIYEIESLIIRRGYINADLIIQH